MASTVAKRRGKARRWIWTGIVSLALVAGGALVAQRYLGASTAPLYRTVAVERGTVERTVAALGSVQPRDYVDVGAQVSGQLDRLHVAIGDRVTSGDLLAEIDPRVYEARVAVDRAELQILEARVKQRQAELKLARHQAERNAQLIAKKVVSVDAHQTTQTAVAVAEASVEELMAQIEQAKSTLEGDETNLSYTKIYAPMTGTVVQLPAVAGQTLNANQTAPMILRIADLDTMTVEAQVSEADVVKVKVGMTVWFTTLGTPERRWEATVRQILPTPEIVNDVVLYDVLIDVANTDGVLMTDMTAQVFFVLGRSVDAVIAPLASLQRVPGGGEDAYELRVLTPAGPQTRQVRVGLTSRSQAEVLEGLAPGDRVILGEEQPGVAGSGAGGGAGPLAGMRRVL